MFLYYPKSALSLFTINLTNFTCQRMKASELKDNDAWKPVTPKLQKQLKWLLRA